MNPHKISNRGLRVLLLVLSLLDTLITPYTSTTFLIDTILVAVFFSASGFFFHALQNYSAYNISRAVPKGELPVGADGKLRNPAW